MNSKLYLCSSNRGKLHEFALAAASTPFAVETLPGLRDIAPPEETGQTFEENAQAKALYYSGFTSEMVLADDSGLEVDTLGGAPGVFSARYAGEEATDEDNNRLLLHNLENARSRDGRFVCVVTVAHKGRPLVSARGTVDGLILSAPRGTNGFGYDSLFFYPPGNRSFAELTDEEKLVVSARGRALAETFRQLVPIHSRRASAPAP